MESEVDRPTGDGKEVSGNPAIELERELIAAFEAAQAQLRSGDPVAAAASMERARALVSGPLGAPAAATAMDVPRLQRALQACAAAATAHRATLEAKASSSGAFRKAARAYERPRGRGR